MVISTYLLKGFDVLPKEDITINSVVIDGVYNQLTHRDNKIFGGFEPDDQALVYVRTQDVYVENLYDIKDLIGTRVTFRDKVWRIIDIKVGDAISHFTIISTNKQ